MGFWEKAGQVAGDYVKSTIEDTQRKMERIQKYEERFDRLSDDELKKKLKTTSNNEMKMAIINLLKQRGY